MIINRLFELRDEAERFRLDLEALVKKEQPVHKFKIQEHIEILREELKKSEVPENFRIAVVGTFKTGKSSFVNKLAEERLAGVETNPETAAISIFRYSEVPRVEVKLLSSAEWARMVDLYEDAPKHPEAYRVAGLYSFNEDMAKRQEKSDKPRDFQPVDIEKLTAEWLTPDGLVHVINSDNWQAKTGKQEFRKEIRRFTSSRDPLHYFVKELVIYAPVPLLKDHVELIDTPGLNDTQLYRGQLTEDLLANVDAILFLTRSGASFSQFDKEFLIRQLRKKRLKHLRLVVTQIDHTYEAAVRDAQDEDEDRPTLKQVIVKEEARLRSEINKTLDELLGETELKDEDGYYYLEQLNSLQIHFTSSHWFDDGRIEDSGIPEVKEALFDVLSENYHLTQLTEHLERTLSALRSRLREFFLERQQVMDAEFDSTKVHQSIEKLEGDLAIKLESFKKSLAELEKAHRNDQNALNELIQANIARMQLLAREVLSAYEKSDVSRHWKTKRHGYWGFLNDLGGRVADRVFPILESSLKRKIRPFGDFLDLSAAALDKLQADIVSLEAESAVAGLPKIEFGEAKTRFMSSFVDQVSEQVNSEKDSIIEVLEEFASTELKAKLSGAREEVYDVRGKGTTFLQNSVVSDFYGDISNTLSQALNDFLNKRLTVFGDSLVSNAESLFPKLKAAIELQLATRKQAIEDQLHLQSSEARKQMEQFFEQALAVLDGQHLAGESAVKIKKDSPDEIELVIPEDATGYSYDSLFSPYLADAEYIEIKEPYLRLRYQLDNLQRFCELITRLGKIKSIELTTASLDGEEKDQSDSRLEDISRLLKKYDITMNWKRDPALHHREMKTNDGWLILCDRGLDIFKKPESWNDFGHFDQALRLCKLTKIHVRRVL